ncbi:hypothetical protein [Glaciecola sp. MF2-115]|uniref:hypothetical protein n=1 Tax=Glaciecola sp. MF2-115 TaxID=3384827 RepID=UPI0039A116F4
MKVLKIVGLVALFLVLVAGSFIVYMDYEYEKELAEERQKEDTFIKDNFSPIIDAYLTAVNSCDVEASQQMFSSKGQEAIMQSAELKKLYTSVTQASCRELTLSVKDFGKFHNIKEGVESSVRVKLTAAIKNKSNHADDDIYRKWKFIKEQGVWRINSLAGVNFAAQILEEELGIKADGN